MRQSTKIAQLVGHLRAACYRFSRRIVYMLKSYGTSHATTTQMMNRRAAVRLMGSATAGVFIGAAARNASAANSDSTPPLAPGAPMSPERIALIEAFKKQSQGLEEKFEARTHQGDWAMP